MKTIRNCTARPLKIPLPRGKFLHLGPRNTGQVHLDALERPAVKKLLESGDLEVVEDDATRRGNDAARGGPTSTHGHPPGTGVHRKGDR
jgi:hypothetical protein